MATPFDLRIRFAGMCLLVHDRDEDRLHVLMPPTGPELHVADGTDHEHASDDDEAGLHVARLLYDRAYERPGQKPGGAQMRMSSIELENRALDATGLITEHRLDPNMHLRDVVNLGPVTRKRVDPALFRSKTGDRVLSRATLAAGSIGPHDPGVKWKLKNHGSAHRAIWVEWTIRKIEQEFLRLVITGMNGVEFRTELTLFPFDNAIDLFVFHSPEVELPETLPPPPRLDAPVPPRAHHFMAYYNLFTGPYETPLPEHDPESTSREQHHGDREGGQSIPGGTDHDHPDPRHPEETIGGSRVTCILASAEADSP